MPRRRVAERRAVLPDPVYNSPLVTKFINGIMWGGKRSIAERTFYTALLQVGEKAGEEPLKVFKRAIENVRPTVEVKSRQRSEEERRYASHGGCQQGLRALQVVKTVNLKS